MVKAKDIVDCMTGDKIQNREGACLLSVGETEIDCGFVNPNRRIPVTQELEGEFIDQYCLQCRLYK